MLVFLAIIIVMIVCVLLSIMPALLRPNSRFKQVDNLEKREIFNQQFAEIAQDKAMGVLDDKQYNIAKNELERRLLEEVGHSHEISAPYAKPDRRMAVILGLLVPILSIWLYLNIGRPIAILPPDVIEKLQQGREQELQTEASSSQANMTIGTPAIIEGAVRLAPTLASKVKPDMIVYVFARAAQGSPMPYAIVKIKVKDLPYQYHLDDNNALMPNHKLSQASEVVVVARVATMDDAKAQAGDLEGLSPVIKPADGKKVDIEINQIVN